MNAHRANRWLSIYLNDHLAGATAGVALSRRVARNWRGRGFDESLDRIAREIEEDRAALIDLMSWLGVRRNALKPLVAVTVERLHRAKPNGVLLGRSPLSDLIELETLALGVTGKADLWRAVRAATNAGPLLGEVDELLARALRQQKELEEMQLSVAGRVLELLPATSNREAPSTAWSA